MPDEPEFQPGLFRGAADDYDRFRVGYPAAMVADLIGRAGVPGQGRLLDLACGTGQLTFALVGRFRQVWAVGQEPDMIRVVGSKAASAGAGVIRAFVSRAEDLTAEAGSFELVVIGNAFHRLRRAAVAAKVLTWLQPGGCLALCWASSPWTGEEEWQRAMSRTLDRWKAKLAAEDRVPAGWAAARAARPDTAVLAGAGFEVTGSFAFPSEHRWTIAELAGFVYSTSFLPHAVLGGQAANFEADLAAALSGYAAGGALRETFRFGYDLARRPG